MKKKLIPVSLLLLFACLLIAFCNWIVNRRTEAYIFSSVANIPHHRVGLVLGTSKMLRNGYPNLYFSYRIQAAAELYKSGKVDYLLVSGDNGNKNYNEPEDMQQSLIAMGIPAKRIYLDYAGFRTLDSVVRAKEIFGQEEFIVVSQPFHNQRAVFLARQKGIKAIAYNAHDVRGANSYKTRTREWLARVKVFVDLYIGKEPHFLGKKIIIGT